MASCQAKAEQQSDGDGELRREIGQMLMVGFRGTEVSDTSQIIRDIEEYNIGGVILFEYDAASRSRPRNIASREQLRDLCKRLQERAKYGLLIGIDQEGGRVTRLKESYGFPRFASAKKSAEGGDDSVRHYAALTAEVLESMGINLNFAPCVDVNVNPQCPIIGKLGRSYGEDADKVAHYAKIWINEHRNRGIISCPKHFPGHGSSKSDTHKGLADVSDTWQEWELEPYRQLIAEGEAEMIMTTHVFNAKLDSRYPATLSQATLTGLLRDSLKYSGVIITDDMAMGAMTQQYEYAEMVRLAIVAGADMLCLSNNGESYNPDIVKETIELIYKMVKDGEIPAERIHQSSKRVKALKERYQVVGKVRQ